MTEPYTDPAREPLVVCEAPAGYEVMLNVQGVRPGYKMSEVGVIPEDWEVATLQNVCAETITYGIVQCGPHIANGVPYIRVSDMNGPSLDVSGMLRTSQAIASQFSRSQVEEGDVVYALRGKIGEVRTVDETVSGANLTQGTARLSPSGRVDSTYLLYSLRSQRALRQGDLAAKGSTFREITLEALRQIELPIAPLPEQRAIAAALSDVDALIAKLDQFIAKKRDLKQAAMQQLLTSQTRLPGFSGAWEVKRLGDSCELVTKGTTPTSIGKSFTKSGINFLKAESISESGKTISDKVAFIDEATHRLLKRSQLMINDVLISIAGVLGRVGLVEESDLPANTNQALAIVRLGKESAVIRIFLFYCLSSPLIERQISDFNVQAAQANISLQNVRDLMIHLPPTKAEQTAIATVLSDMDAELAALEARRDKTRALKQGMMQELLTGRIRLA